MPSRQTMDDTGILALEEKIRELDVREARQGGLSQASHTYRQWLRKWREFAGTDVVLVIEPVGVLRRRGERHEARLVEVHDDVAADLITFAAERRQRVRPATEEEIALYRAQVKAEQEAARGQIAADNRRLAQAQLATIMGTAGALNAAVETPPMPEPPKVNFGEDFDAEDVQLPGTKKALETGGLRAVASERQAEALAEIGFTTLEQVAAASPQDLARASGIGPARAAELIAKASEALAKLADPEESEPDEGESPEE